MPLDRAPPVKIPGGRKNSPAYYALGRPGQGRKSGLIGAGKTRGFNGIRRPPPRAAGRFLDIFRPNPRASGPISG